MLLFLQHHQVNEASFNCCNCSKCQCAEFCNCKLEFVASFCLFIGIHQDFQLNSSVFFFLKKLCINLNLFLQGSCKTFNSFLLCIDRICKKIASFKIRKCMIDSSDCFNGNGANRILTAGFHSLKHCL